MASSSADRILAAPEVLFCWFLLIFYVRRFVLLIFLAREKVANPSVMLVPEDRVKLGGMDPLLDEKSDVALLNTADRINKVFANDVDNDMMNFILLLAVVAFTGSETRVIIYGSIYAVARIFYAFFYINAIQPWRSRMFLITMINGLVMNIDLLVKVSKDNQ